MENIYESPYYLHTPDEPGYSLKNKYKEILRLQKMLEKASIPHVFRRWMDGWMVMYPASRPLESCVMDAIEMSGSYGCNDDLLEIMGLLTPEEEERDSVVGYLTAENVFERIRKHWETHKED